MRGTAIASVFCLSVGFACTTSMQISFDPRDDFSNYRTWNWISATPRSIDAPTPYVVGLERAMALLVAQELERSGLEQVDVGADLGIGVLLNIRHEVVTIAETGAVETLSSLTSGPRYEIQATTTRQETQEHSRMVIFAIDPRSGKVVWKGAMEELFQGDIYPHLERTIASLVERFPSEGRANELPTSDPAPASDSPSMFTASPPPAEPDV